MSSRLGLWPRSLDWNGATCYYEAMDYRELFKKYLRMIAEVEGVIFVSQMEIAGFTREEIDAVEQLDAENEE